MNRRDLIRLAATATLATALPLAAQAQSDYPNKAVKIIVPFPGRRHQRRDGAACWPMN